MHVLVNKLYCCDEFNLKIKLYARYETFNIISNLRKIINRASIPNNISC